ncbi:MAG: dTDP-glucose 4,6-dehydratase [Candidatus Amoebophilus sp. 36-38]|nr:MAG: dTDP-glucose 4,6-dehydratase [Candidatus Amoebophilus sp. 36-38]
MKNILITGGAGFIGSNFIPYFLEKYANYQIVNVDKLTYAGSLDNLLEVACHPQYHFFQGDITDQAFITSLFKKFDFQGVIHLAAESHVDRSIQDPTPFVKTNLEGTFILLEAARLYWLNEPGLPKKNHVASRFLQVSTDEVYGSLGPTGFFTEETAYAPNNPYSATKAGSDLLVHSYIHTYGLNAVTTHASNNYGPKQYAEKLIPKVIQHALQQKSIPIHGQGKAIRDWLYVLDHCKGIDLAFHHGKSGEHYNFGGNHEETNLQIAYQVCILLDELAPLPERNSYKSLITFVTDRPGNDQRYALNIQKAKNELNWEPKENFEIGLRKTVEWYLKMFNKNFNI